MSVQAEVFRRISPVYINNDVSAYYRSIATLQGNQLRALVQDSIGAYQALFERHIPVMEVAPQQDQARWSHPAVFVVEMSILDGEWNADLL